MSSTLKHLGSSSENKDSEVGYGRPPKQHRFEKGQSGNPKGRPKKKTATFDLRAIAQEELFRLVTVTENGKKRTMPVFQALLRKHLVTAASGNGTVPKLVIDVLRWLMQTNGETSKEDSIDDMLNWQTILNILPGTEMPENPVL